MIINQVKTQTPQAPKAPYRTLLVRAKVVTRKREMPFFEKLRPPHPHRDIKEVEFSLAIWPAQPGDSVADLIAIRIMASLMTKIRQHWAHREFVKIKSMSMTWVNWARVSVD